MAHKYRCRSVGYIALTVSLLYGIAFASLWVSSIFIFQTFQTLEKSVGRMEVDALRYFSYLQPSPSDTFAKVNLGRN